MYPKGWGLEARQPSFARLSVGSSVRSR
jgi:hypothetical protein